jgi:hypothetical protein
VDGELRSTGFSYLLDSALLDLGDHSVVARVHDPTDAVRSDSSGLLTESASWTLHVQPSKCDVNRDGKTNILDLQLIIKQLLGLLPRTSDVNDDGKVNVLDLKIVLDAVLGRSCPN